MPIADAPTFSEEPWRPAPDLIWTRYHDSDNWVVFHPRSGDVYLVTAAAHLLWQLIAEGRRPTVDHLIVDLAAALQRQPDEELAAVTRDTLAFMDRSGLIQPISF